MTTAASIRRPASVSSYITILPSRCDRAMPGTLQHAQVMGDELFAARDYEADVADAERFALVQRERDRQPGRIAVGFRAASEQVELGRGRQCLPDALGLGRVKAQ